MVRFLLALCLLFTTTVSASAQDVGVFIRSGTSSILNPVSGQTYVLDYSTTPPQLKGYSGSSYYQMTPPKANYTATVVPTSNDDDAHGYQIGSVWINTNTGLVYYCLDATTMAAVWGPAGSGTVTSVNCGSLSPLFSTGVSDTTTDPTISFTLSGAAAHTFFGNNTGSTGAPGYHAIAAADLPSTAVNSTSGLSPLFSSSITAQALNFTQSNAAAGSMYGNFNATSSAPSFNTGGTDQIPARLHSGPGMGFKNLVQGANIVITQDDTNITIRSTGGGGGGTFVPPSLTNISNVYDEYDGIIVSPDNLYLYAGYVDNGTGNATISKILISDGSIVGTVDLGNGDDPPSCMMISPNGATVYSISGYTRNLFWAVDTASMTLTHTATLATQFSNNDEAFDLSPDGSFVAYASQTPDQFVHFLDTTTWAETSIGVNHSAGAANVLAVGFYNGSNTNFYVSYTSTPIVDQYQVDGTYISSQDTGLSSSISLDAIRSVSGTNVFMIDSVGQNLISFQPMGGTKVAHLVSSPDLLAVRKSNQSQFAVAYTPFTLFIGEANQANVSEIAMPGNVQGRALGLALANDFSMRIFTLAPNNPDLSVWGISPLVGVTTVLPAIHGGTGLTDSGTDATAFLGSDGNHGYVMAIPAIASSGTHLDLANTTDVPTLTLTAVSAAASNILECNSFGNTGGNLLYLDNVGNLHNYGSILSTAGGFIGDGFYASTIGSGLQIKAGANARLGSGTFSSGVCVVSNTSITANSKVFCQPTGGGTAALAGEPVVVSTSAGVGFTVDSLTQGTGYNVTDDNSFDYWILEAVP